MFGIGFLVGFTLFWGLFKFCEHRFAKTKYKIEYDAKADEYDLIDPDRGFDGIVIYSSKNIDDVYARHRMILEKKSKLPIILNK